MDILSLSNVKGYIFKFRQRSKFRVVEVMTSFLLLSFFNYVKLLVITRNRHLTKGLRNKLSFIVFILVSSFGSV